MSSPFAGKLLVSDIDGTLLYDRTNIPQRNIDAVRRFQEGGGLFTLSTGRPWQSAAHLFEIFEPKAPGIFLNGASIYDIEAGKTVDEIFLPDGTDELVAEMHMRFPTSAIKVFARDMIYVVHENQYSEGIYRVVPIECQKADVNALPTGKYKLLWMDDPEVIVEMRRWYEENAPKGTSAFCSCAEYFEIMPAGVDKGSGLCRLRDMLGIRKENSCAIGDYENDVAMLRSAGISASPSSGDDSAKQAATVIVGDCTGGAVADFIEYLEKT